ncbi:hypothetical protein [Gracilimonas sp. BCB1]|uniref:hypothetical protein n=1 Tax=Gracilimonas sp. BCB1 TaxID=3152362 RepID=UPI0032D8E2F4
MQYGRKILLGVIVFSILTVALCLCFHFGKAIPIGTQKEIVELLLTVASIVFGIMGVWLAVVFPNSLSIAFDREAEIKDKKEALKDLRFLTLPMIISAIIICYVLLFHLLHPIVVNFSFLLTYIPLIRGLSFSIISVIVIMQIWTLIYIFAPGEKLRIKALIQMKKEERGRGLNSETQSLKKMSKD